MSETADRVLHGPVKAPTGISGLDQILEGGLPAQRSTLLMGAAGTGKTVLCLEFLYRGCTDYGEPGVYVTFEEEAEDVLGDTESFGWDLAGLVEAGRLAVIDVPLEADPVVETGAFDLSGLFARIDHAIRSRGARRLVLDGPAALFDRFASPGRVRTELARLLRWLRERGMTVMVTAEAIESGRTRSGVEPFVVDCVIELARLREAESSFRGLTVAKYRGSSHGANLYPFAVGRHGLEVWPVTSAALDHPVSSERISSGMPQLDEMLGGEGYFRGSTILVSGTAGSGKSTFGVSLIDAACRRGERGLLISYEESPQQIARNTASLGLDLQRWMDAGLLRVQSIRASSLGLEQHLIEADALFRELSPSVVVLDPISSLAVMGTPRQAKLTAVRLIDRLKRAGVTTLLTYLAPGDSSVDVTAEGISSIVDTWLTLRDLEAGGERNKAVLVLKSRGMAHSNQLREFHFTEAGVELVDVYAGPGGVLTGTARLAQEARERAEARRRADTIEGLRSALESRRRLTEARVAALQAELEEESRRVERAVDEHREEERAGEENRRAMERTRRAAAPSSGRER